MSVDDKTKLLLTFPVATVLWKLATPNVAGVIMMTAVAFPLVWFNVVRDAMRERRAGVSGSSFKVYPPLESYFPVGRSVLDDGVGIKITGNP